MVLFLLYWLLQVPPAGVNCSIDPDQLDIKFDEPPLGEGIGLHLLFRSHAFICDGKQFGSLYHVSIVP